MQILFAYIGHTAHAGLWYGLAYMPDGFAFEWQTIWVNEAGVGDGD